MSPSRPGALPSLALPSLRAAYATGALDPVGLVERLLQALAATPQDPAWIVLASADALRAEAAALQARSDRATLPLYGVPFAVKDNIDVAGWPTTAACPDFAYRPGESSRVVQRLRDAGAILLGKTNLDQFATGLVGTRSPYGAVPNAFDPRYISGGSSSGSASVCARGLVSFALGTDTAGSGRVPAGFNNLVGLKPTRGLLSTRGVVPACRTLDCVSIFTLTADDAAEVLAQAAGFDAADPFSRAAPGTPVAPIRRVGVPREPQFFGDHRQAAAYATALDAARALGLSVETVDLAPFEAVARLLYEGPWVAERRAAVGAFYDAHAESIEPTVRGILASADRFSARDAFEAQYRLAALQRECGAILAHVDALLLPTAPTIYRTDEVLAEPLLLNTRLGFYTNFVNLLDLAAVAVPTALRDDGLPFGVTFVSAAWSERALLELAARWQQAAGLPLGATGATQPAAADHPRSGVAPDRVRVAVVGAHLSGMPLNHQLTGRDAVLAGPARTAQRYRLFALAGTVPAKPGLLRVDDGDAGASIELELWDIPLARLGSFVAEVAAPLAIGSLQLDDGAWVKGFVCEAHAVRGARDITSYGGWRAWLRAQPS